MQLLPFYNSALSVFVCAAGEAGQVRKRLAEEVTTLKANGIARPNLGAQITCIIHCQ